MMLPFLCAAFMVQVPSATEAPDAMRSGGPVQGVALGSTAEMSGQVASPFDGTAGSAAASAATTGSVAGVSSRPDEASEEVLLAAALRLSLGQ